MHTNKHVFQLQVVLGLCLCFGHFYLPGTAHCTLYDKILLYVILLLLADHFSARQKEGHSSSCTVVLVRIELYEYYISQSEDVIRGTVQLENGTNYALF